MTLLNRLKRYSPKCLTDALDSDFAGAVWEAVGLLEDIEDDKPLKHGAWDYIMPVDGPERCRYQCSECHWGALRDYWGDDVKSLFCPSCGACMDGEGKKYWEEYDGELRLAE